MTTFIAALVPLLLASTAALAQIADPASPGTAAAEPAASVVPDPSTIGRDGKVRLDVVRARCRGQLGGSGIPAAGLQDALVACIVKARPDRAVQVRCRMDPQTRGMDRDDRRAFVKECIARAQD